MRLRKLIVGLAVLPLVATSGRPTGVAGWFQAQDRAKVLLAEILFAPVPGDTGFVELLNIGDQAVDLTSMVLRIDTVDLPLPRLAEPFAPGARVVIRFDGRAVIEGLVVHSSPGFDLNPQDGMVSLLRNDDVALDHVAWGALPGAVRPVFGGRSSPGVEPGSSFGRPPGANRPGATTDWVLYPPGQVTPGRANPMPPVLQLLPLDGAIVESSPVDLKWYPVSGAARYRVQLARDSVFSSPLLERTVTAPAISSGQLSPGIYWWRVQAIGVGEVPASWSQPSRLEIAPQGGGNPPGHGRGDGGLDVAIELAPILLNVPYLTQHKDSRMLLLESYQEGHVRTAAMLPQVPHKWDGDHGTLDPNDPADNMSCCLASFTMLNHFHGGDLSQDRIGYEALSRNVNRYVGRVNIGSIRSPFGPTPLREVAPGPDYDLMYGGGSTDEQILVEGLFALGVLPGAGSGYLSQDAIWSLVMAEINAGRPLLGFNCCHCFVIRGFASAGGKRLLYLNDPWVGQYALDLDAPSPRPVQGAISYLGVRAARQEPEVTNDSDRDGVVDFDEVQRFRTNPNNSDSDADGVLDKLDLESGVYETEHGYGYAWTPGPNSSGRDYDHDGIPTELDVDSDNGGCKDGDEDLDGDGIHAGAETGNFDQTDDVCGNLQGNVSYLIDAVNTDPNQIVKQTHEQGVIQVRLKPESPGSAHYIDGGSTFSFQAFARIEIDLGQCTLWAREVVHASGPMTGGDADIGATVGDDGTIVLGVLKSVPSQRAGGGCGLPGGTGQSERTLSFPDCNGVRMPARPGQPNVPTYRFDCTTKPNPGSGWTVTQFYARGYVRLQ